MERFAAALLLLRRCFKAQLHEWEIIFSTSSHPALAPPPLDVWPVSDKCLGMVNGVLVYYQPVMYGNLPYRDLPAFCSTASSSVIQK